jgi:hypothetical protein
MDVARGGHEGALVALVERHRERLECRFELRMARRLLGRVDPADGVRESCLAQRGKFPQDSAELRLPFSLWLRLEIGQRFEDVNRFHPGTQTRETGRRSPYTTGSCLG